MRLQLDTNVLIAISHAASPLKRRLHSLVEDGVAIETSAIAWHEFMRGPVRKGEPEALEAALQSRIIPLERDAAELGAILFNLGGRRRNSAVDCLIAAVAITREAHLLTRNIADFERFAEHGLKLA